MKVGEDGADGKRRKLRDVQGEYLRLPPSFTHYIHVLQLTTFLKTDQVTSQLSPLLPNPHARPHLVDQSGLQRRPFLLHDSR